MDPVSPVAPAPERLNLQQFALRQGRLEGDLAVRDLPRLASALSASDVELAALRVHWTLEGEMRTQPGREAYPVVVVRVQAELPMQCQRCLQPALQVIDDSAVLRLVDEEPELTLEELEAEDEAFCARVPVDVRELVEDQMILALPLVPMHVQCPQPIAAGGLQPSQAKVSPFAALASLKKAD